MRLRFRDNSKVMAEINMTPLIDVMLVLLVIFMITAPMLTTGIDVDLPKTTSKTLPVKKDPIIVSVDESSRIYIGNMKVGFEELIGKLKAIHSVNGNTSVYVKADRKLKYEMIVKVIGVINRAGFSQVSLVTDN